MKHCKSLFVLTSLILPSCAGNVSSALSSSSHSEESSLAPLSSESLSSDVSYSEISTSVASSEEIIDMAPIDDEIRGCFRYFNDLTNYGESSKGYGLVLDRYTNKALASIAATGFGLAAYPVFVEENLLEKEEAKEKVSKTLDTLLRMQADESVSYKGCLSHFVSRASGARSGQSEISTIDTAILVSGAISAGEYFGGEVKEKAETLWSNVDFTSFIVTKNGKSYVSMGVNDPQEAKQLSPWDYYAEQWMIYILGAGNPNPDHRLKSLLYKNVTRAKGEYAGITHIYSWFGALFTYQFSQAFFNFKDYNDYKGNNFYENSILASKTAYEFSQTLSKSYKSFSPVSWGLSACDTPLGYSGELGSAPRGFDGYNSEQYQLIQGTIAPYAAISSMPFTPKESYDALCYYQTIPALNDPAYGLRDAFNLDFRGSKWVAPDFIGIDKGITLLQLYNYKNPDFVSNLAMSNDYVKEGFINNEFVPANAA